MTEPLPALCLIAVPGRRRLTIELCRDAEKRGSRISVAPAASVPESE